MTLLSLPPIRLGYSLCYCFRVDWAVCISPICDYTVPNRSGRAAAKSAGSTCRRQDLHNGRVQRAGVHEHGGDLWRGCERVDSHAGHADAAQRRVVHRVSRLPIRDRWLQRTAAHEQRREVRPGHRSVDARCRHVQPAQQFCGWSAGRHDIRSWWFQRRHHHRTGGVLQWPDRWMVRATVITPKQRVFLSENLFSSFENDSVMICIHDYNPQPTVYCLLEILAVSTR